MYTGAHSQRGEKHALHPKQDLIVLFSSILFISIVQMNSVHFQKHATTAGLHFFKCPLCNNKDHFQEEMLRMGVHIPDQLVAHITLLGGGWGLIIKSL